MELLDVKDYVFEGENRTYYDVKYKDKIYRRYKFYWTLILSDGDAGFGSVDVNYQRHLEKKWMKRHRNEKIDNKL